MDVEVRELRFVVALAEELNFAQAAARLGIGQPALSRQLRQLEDRIGARLFDRTTRRVALTAAGESLRVDAEAVLKRLETACETARRLHDGSMGELRIGYNDFAIGGPLARIVRAFRQRYPDVSVTLARGSTQRQLAELDAGAIDVAFVLPPPPSRTRLGREAWRERPVLALPDGHPLAERSRIALSALNGEATVAGDPERWGAYRAHLDAMLTSAGIEVEVVAEGPDAQVILGLVEAGFGVAILPECVANLSRRGVSIRPLDGVPEAAAWVETHACWRRDDARDLLANFLAVCDEALAREASSAPGIRLVTSGPG